MKAVIDSVIYIFMLKLRHIYSINIVDNTT